jgi:uncharacterized membrane protein SirB2
VELLKKRKDNLYLAGALLLCSGIALLLIEIPLRYYGKGSPVLIIIAMALVLLSVVINFIYINKTNKKSISKK